MNKESGFTLMELAITTAIIGILAAIAIPNGIAWISKGRVNASARDIASMLQKAKIEAARETAFVIVQFDAAGNYTAFVNNGEGTPDADSDGILDGATNWVQDGTERTVAEGGLRPGVSMVGNPFNTLAPSLDGTNNRFNPRTLPSVSGDIVLTNNSGYTVTVALNTGGVISIQ